MNLTEQFQQLKALYDQGILTDEEFSLAKKKLIDGMKVEASSSANTNANANSSGSRDGSRDTAASGASFASLNHRREISALEQLKRSYYDRWIGGVCGGLAVSTNIPAWSWRLLFVLLTLLHGIGALMYILLWIFVPLKIENFAPTEKVVRPEPARAAEPVSPASPSAASTKNDDPEIKP